MIEEHQLEDIFLSGGMLDKAFDSFEKRDDQLEMAILASRVYNENINGVIEAGTGIGKSYAYLSVALLNALENKEDRTVIATSNVALQQQLMNKDIPTLENALDMSVPYALLLGRGRYVCFNRMMNAVKGFRNESQELFKDEDSQEEAVYDWFRNTRTGIIEELPQRLTSSAFVRNVRSDKDTCLKQRCPYFDKCFYYNALETASKSRIIVTNHALLFIDSSIRAENGEDFDQSVIIPPYNRLIIDECHNIDRSATEFYSLFLNRQRLGEEYRKLFQMTFRNHQGMHLADILTGMNRRLNDGDVRAFITAINQFTSECTILVKSIITGNDRKRFSHECLLTDTETDFDGITKARMQEVLATLDEVLRCFRIIMNIDEVPSEEEVYYRMGNSSMKAYEGFHELLSLFCEHASHPELVFYYRYDRADDVTLTVSPLSVASRLKENLFSRLQSVLCTSATIKTGKDFSYFLSQVGLDEENLVTGFFPSPFDYSHNAMLLYPAAEDGMNFNISVKAEYADYLANMLVPVLRSTEGSALILFTSIEMMTLVYERMKDLIEQTLLIQKKGSSTEQLRKLFREDRTSVLFGLKSFWEGIDVPGDALRLVVITQLPFTHVEDCIKRSRSMDLAANGKNPYMSIDLPEMLITLKQGLGRLIRNESDRGVALIADGRARRYMPLIRACIPPYYIPDEEGLTVASFSQRIEDFLY